MNVQGTVFSRMSEIMHRKAVWGEQAHTKMAKTVPHLHWRPVTQLVTNFLSCCESERRQSLTPRMHPPTAGEDLGTPTASFAFRTKDEDLVRFRNGDRRRLLRAVDSSARMVLVMMVMVCMLL